MTPLLAIAVFGIGAVVVVLATEGLLEGLVDVATALRIAPFVASVILSGLEAENIAVGLAAGQRGRPRSPWGRSSAVPRSCSAPPSAWAR